VPGRVPNALLHAIEEPGNALKRYSPTTSSHRLVTLALTQHIAVLLERAPLQLGLLPQVGCEETVCVGDGHKSSLESVLEGLGRTGRGSVDVLDTGQLQETLDSGRGDKTSTTGRGDETDGDGTALAGLLGGQRVGLTEVGTPVSSPDGNNTELGDDNGGADGSSDFLRGLDAETDVALRVSDNNDGLESRTLTGTGLLLDGLDLHDLVLELGEEEVDDLVLLDGQRVEVAEMC
jgi:hypothetical protein